jgi:hypothetical protein
MPIHCTRDASRDTKLECRDHHPRRSRATPPSDSQPIRRVPRLPPQVRRRSHRRLSDTAALLIGAVDRNNGLTRFKHWQACWTVSGVAGQPALKPRHSATAWISAVTSKSSRRSNCQGLRTGLPALIVNAQAFRQSKERLPLPGRPHKGAGSTSPPHTPQSYCVTYHW